MAYLIIPPWDYVIGQKNHLEAKGHVTNTSSMELARTVVWNFLQLECIVRTGAYTVGDQWNFMIPWR